MNPEPKEYKVRVEKLRIGKGKTVGDEKSGEWTREYYELEIAIEDLGELEVTRANGVGLIDGWLSGLKHTATKPAPQLPQLDPDKLGKLAWKTYKSKEPCKPEDAGWIFRNTPGAEALADLIDKQGNGVTVQIARTSFEVRFSGAEKQFIGRAPVKT